MSKHKEIFESYLTNMLEILSSASNNLIIVGPLPPAVTPFKKKGLLFKPLNLPRELFKDESIEFVDILKEKIKKYKFTYLDLEANLCDEKVCYVTKNNSYLYGDRNHLSSFGQDIILKPLLLEAIKKD